MAALGKEQLAKVRADNPGLELHHIVAGDEEIVVKSPPRAEWKRFRAMYLDPAQRPLALETLLFGCLVHPDAAGLNAILERRPAFAEVFGEKLASAAGLGTEAVEKKL
jgi:hypothetical protein